MGSPELGVPGAFEPEHEITDCVTKGQWIGDCFIFSNIAGRLNYFVGGNTMTLCHLDQQSTGPLFMLGFLPKEDRVYLMDIQERLLVPSTFSCTSVSNCC